MEWVIIEKGVIGTKEKCSMVPPPSPLAEMLRHAAAIEGLTPDIPALPENALFRRLQVPG